MCRWPRLGIPLGLAGVFNHDWDPPGGELVRGLAAAAVEGHAVALAAALLDATRHALAPWPALRRVLLAGSAAVLLAANALLAVEFRLDLAVTGRRPTWHDLGTRRVTFLIEELQRLNR